MNNKTLTCSCQTLKKGCFGLVVATAAVTSQTAKADSNTCGGLWAAYSNTSGWTQRGTVCTLYTGDKGYVNGGYFEAGYTYNVEINPWGTYGLFRFDKPGFWYKLNEPGNANLNITLRLPENLYDYPYAGNEGNYFAAINNAAGNGSEGINVNQGVINIKATNGALVNSHGITLQAGSIAGTSTRVGDGIVHNNNVMLFNSSDGSGVVYKFLAPTVDFTLNSQGIYYKGKENENFFFVNAFWRGTGNPNTYVNLSPNANFTLNVNASTELSKSLYSITAFAANGNDNTLKDKAYFIIQGDNNYTYEGKTTINVTNTSSLVDDTTEVLLSTTSGGTVSGENAGSKGTYFRFFGGATLN